MTRKKRRAPRCWTCRLGPGFRLDLKRERAGNRYRCPLCGTRWKLVTHFFRSRHEEVR